MKSVVVYFTMLVMLIGGKNAFGQDTLFYDDWHQFDQNIKYAYLEYHRTMPPELEDKIDSVFKTVDFTSPEIPCEYGFSFLADLDSCGNITGCSPLNNHLTNAEMKLFETKVNVVLLTSNWQINNAVVLADTTYQFDQFRIHVETSCDPDEVIVAPEGWKWYNGRVLALRKENETLYFYDFMNGCNE